MNKKCINCKHFESESEMTNNMMLGVALGTFFFPQWKTVTRCKNRKSNNFNDEVSEYDSCNNFE
jgi:hypothetical protein